MTTIAGSPRPLITMQHAMSDADEQPTAAELYAQIIGLKVDIEVFKAERDSHPVGSDARLAASIKLSRAASDLRDTSIQYGNQLVREQNQQYEANVEANNHMLHPHTTVTPGNETSYPATLSPTQWFDRLQKWGEDFLVTPAHKAVDQIFDVTPSAEQNNLTKLTMKATIVAAGLAILTRGRFLRVQI